MQIDNELKELYENDYDMRIIRGALNMNGGQSNFQSKYFVAGSQLTQYRSIKQCLLELESRHHGWNDINTKRKRKLVEIKIAEREYNESEDELQRELIAIDIDSMKYDVQVWEKKVKQSNEEIQYFLSLIKEITNGDDNILQKAMSYDEEEERKYWVARMAKQAAMDMVSYGRIGSGNMDSIAMMDEEDQIQTLATTLQYNERLNQGMIKINEAVNQGLLANERDLPKFDVPSITDKLLASEEFQHTPKSETKSESI